MLLRIVLWVAYIKTGPLQLEPVKQILNSNTENSKILNSNIENSKTLL